jgi:hypothetical protein
MSVQINGTTGVSGSMITFPNGNVISVSATVPTTGTYTAGDIVFESTASVIGMSGWKRLTTGSTHILNTDWSYFSKLTLGTAQNTTTGTYIDFTGIPSWVKRITVLLNGISTSGTSLQIMQLGAGSVQTNSYNATASTNGASTTPITTGFIINGRADAANNTRGSVTFTHMGGNIWVQSGCTMAGSGNDAFVLAGLVFLSGTLDRLRLTTVNGTDTFDAGSVNIMYEG